MGKIVSTKNQRDYIEANYLKITSNKIGNHLGYSGGVIKRYMKKNNLILSLYDQFDN